MKKRVMIIVFIVSAVGIALIGVFSKSYYDNRYVSATYYVKVPANQETTYEDILDMNGNKVDTGRNYRFTAYSETKEKKTVEFSIVGKNEKLLEPNEYLKVEASKQVVNGWQRVEKQDVPKDLLNKLDN